MADSTSDNIAFVERFRNAFNRRDLDGLLALCHPDVEFRVPGGKVLRGHEGATAWATSQWKRGIEVEPGRYEEDNERITFHGRLVFHSIETGEVARHVQITAVFIVAEDGVISWDGGAVTNESA